MKACLGRLSPSTQALADKLSPPLSSSLVVTLEQIGETHEPLAIPHLMPFGLARDAWVRASARVAIARLFAHVPLEFLPLLDEVLRRSWVSLDDWHGLRPDTVSSLGRGSSADQLYLALTSCHRDGYVRAEALRAFGLVANDIAIPFLMVRLTDWVTAVREIAEDGFRERLTPVFASTFVDCLGLFDRLRLHSRFRSEHPDRVHGLLASAECAEALRRGTLSPSREVRRQSYRQAISNRALNPDGVLALARHDPDVIIRNWAFRAGPDLQNEPELLRQAAIDPYGPIRRLAFQAAVKNLPQSPEVLEPFLFDHSRSIRLECQSVFVKSLGRPPADIYRQAVRSRREDRAGICILGLAETGVKGDADLIAPMLSSESARVRRATVRALRTLGLTGWLETLLGLISSDFPCVAREAAQTLLLDRTFDAAAIWIEASFNPDHRVHRAVLRLMRYARKWTQLRLYLEAAASARPDLTECAIRLLQRWVDVFNKTFAEPTAADTEACRALVDVVRHRLAPSLVVRLAFILRS